MCVYVGVCACGFWLYVFCRCVCAGSISHHHHHARCRNAEALKINILQQFTKSHSKSKKTNVHENNSLYTALISVDGLK